LYIAPFLLLFIGQVVRLSLSDLGNEGWLVRYLGYAELTEAAALKSRFETAGR